VFLSIKTGNMKKNMGSADRIIRVLIALAIGILYFTGTITGILGIVLLVLSIVFILTSLVGTCPLYVPLGIKTCSAKSKK
jgi:K+-transporting ATPase A subunit